MLLGTIQRGRDQVGIKGFGFLAFFAVIAIYVVVIYNNLVRLKNNVAKAWSNIDVLLKQRHDELPNLVETCKQYMVYEQQTLVKVAEARSAISVARQHADAAALGPAEDQLRSGLGQLFAVAEKYPDLKANETFRNLQSRISGLESAIADRREFYNDTVTELNVRIEQFPDRFIASLFAFGSATPIRFSQSELKQPDLKALFN